MLNNKFRLKKEHKEKKIITKSKDGNDVLITRENFNDYFADLLLTNGMGYLIERNPEYDVTTEEKKTFVQMSENVIALTYDPMQIDGKEQKETAKQRKSRSDAGKPRTRKA